MPDSEQKIECPTHGEAEPTYVCGHLANDPQQQWYCDYPSEENPWPDSWCSACDRAFQKEGEWNEKNEPGLDVTLMCHCCYEEFKGRTVAPLMEARSESWQPFLSDAVSELRTKQDLLNEEFGLSRHERWDWDQETGEIVFTNAGWPALIARIQFVGSVSKLSHTWLWSWANPSFEANTVKYVPTLRAFGEAEHFANLTVPKWPAEEVDGWEMTAVAAKVLDAEGAYRTPCDTGFTFMLLLDVRRAQ
jgi:hypothetical protein